MKKNPETFIISRTDNLGDVILTLPLATVLKQLYPTSVIYFFGKKYTRPVIDSCKSVDHFLDKNEFDKLSVFNQKIFLKKIKADAIIHVFPDRRIAKAAKAAGIPIRIGTSHRWYHLIYCNKRINISRKNSDLHEAQLNLKLIESLGAKNEYSLEEIKTLFNFSVKKKNFTLINDDNKNKFKLILHPGTKGSAREWGADNFYKLAQLFPPEKYQIFITGNEEEKKHFIGIFDHLPNVKNLMGEFTLEEFIEFINQCDGMVAASTGPLHIAAILGKVTAGIFSPMRPIFPTRWAPLGMNTKVFVNSTYCDDCRKSDYCKCIRDIDPKEIFNYFLASAINFL